MLQVRLCKLPKVTQLVGGRGRIQTQEGPLQSLRY